MIIRLLMAAAVLCALSSNAEARRYRQPGVATIVSHPAGCPRRAFCACGASVEVFGRPIRSLYLAAAWLKFKRTDPAPGKVAARRGHVFVLKEHVAGSIWLVVDHNSGGRKSRIHHRSIAGFAIVDPNG